MGNFDGNKTNDFIPRGSDNSLPSTLSQEEIFHQFGKTWRTKAEDSKFFYKQGGAWSDFNDVNFIPKFLPKEIPKEVQEACKGSDGKLNENCAYDLINTNNQKLAAASKATQEEGDKLANEVSNNMPTIAAFKADGVTNFTILECEVSKKCTFTLVAEDKDNGDTLEFDTLSKPQFSSVFISPKTQANNKREAEVELTANKVSPNATDILT